VIERDIPWNTNKKKGRIFIMISIKANFRIRKITSVSERHKVRTKESVLKK
jgi:hypothetical protein